MMSMKKRKINTKFVKGFTLIEMLVAIIMVSLLITGGIMAMNPFKQLSKGHDSQRRTDIQAIKTALDSYYQDNKCYPTSLNFGGTLAQNGVVYMKKLPQDPNYNPPSNTGYIYKVSGDSCPQWNALFAKLDNETGQTNACALLSMGSSCQPSWMGSGSWACALSGSVDCSSL